MVILNAMSTNIHLVTLFCPPGDFAIYGFGGDCAKVYPQAILSQANEACDMGEG